MLTFLNRLQQWAEKVMEALRQSQEDMEPFMECRRAEARMDEAMRRFEESFNQQQEENA